MNDREAVARRFMAIYRNNRQTSPDRLLSLWVTWGAVRNSMAFDVAEDVVNGYAASVAIDAERYSIATVYEDHARRRWVKAAKAKRATR